MVFLLVLVFLVLFFLFFLVLVFLVFLVLVFLVLLVLFFWFWCLRFRTTIVAQAWFNFPVTYISTAVAIHDGGLPNTY